MAQHPKNPIKFAVVLNEEQKRVKEQILTKELVFLTGEAGSGKSLLAAQIALDLLFRKQVEKIILTRPVVAAGEDLGFLPGDKDAKLAPYTASIYDNMYRLYNKEKIDKEIEEGRIVVIPIGFMRGRNFSNSMVLIDEAQNITHEQFELIITRLCLGSKMIFVGDRKQIDLKDKKQSGFQLMAKKLSSLDEVGVYALSVNHRHPLVEKVIKILDES